MSRRVVVTGMGIYSPLGTNISDLRDNLFNGVSAIKPQTYEYRDSEFSITTPAAAIEDKDDILKTLGRDVQRGDLYAQFAVAAADQAIKDSGLDFTKGANSDANSALGKRTATIIGSGIGGQHTSDVTQYNMLVKKRRPHPLSILRIIPNAAASHVSIRYGLTGPSFAIASACASAAHSIGMCAELIRTGMADVGIAGAGEKVLSYGALEAWKAMHILADEQCRPFAKDRNGLVIGEGAGILVLEDYDHARARGASIHGELIGFGMNADGNDMINPSLEGGVGAMEMALRDVTIKDASKLYINAHGTGTLLNDPTETKAIKTVFDYEAERLIVSSTKSMHGHLLGAAGAIEAIASILALQNNIVPPTINLHHPDPDCDLNYAAHDAVERPLDVALSNSFAFGGQNAVLAFGKV